MDPGLGKTSITLSAFSELQDAGTASKMLVIAPLRVCQLVWRQEAEGWSQFRHLKFALLHGPKKDAALQSDADVYLINPEGITWLWKKLYGKRFPFDTVTFDELTKFKNAQAVRHKRVMPLLKTARRRWGLTGTPIPNGYLDLFGQMKVLDDGAALGKYFSHFRDKYFEKDYTGFSYNLRRGAGKKIEAAISSYVLRMSAGDYLDLPKEIEDVRVVSMPAKARKVYENMKRNMVAMLEDNVVEAGNAAAVYSKLKQMANGAVYAGDGLLEPRQTVHIHDAKIEAIQELVEELNGKPLLVAYEFRHDLERLLKAFGDKTPYLGHGVSDLRASKIEKDWNSNKIPVLLAHPASAGHGLNLQKGNACHVAWFSMNWDYELYDQFLKRILRQGNSSDRIFNHIFVVDQTIDNKVQEARDQKHWTQAALLDALNAEICQDGKAAATPKVVKRKAKEADMVRKLSRKSAVEDTDVNEEVDDVEEGEEEDKKKDEDEDPAPRRRTRRSPMTRKTRRSSSKDEDDGGDDGEERPMRRTRRSSKSISGTKSKLRGKSFEDDEDKDVPVSNRARDKFSKSVQERLNAEEDDEGSDDPDAEETSSPKTRPSRRPTAPKETPVKSTPVESAVASGLGASDALEEAASVLKAGLSNSLLTTLEASALASALSNLYLMLSEIEKSKG